MSKFNWGDTIRVVKSAPSGFHPNQLGEVCGLYVIKSSEESIAHKQSVGTTVYLIEFSDGNSIEIPENHLELYKNPSE